MLEALGQRPDVIIAVRGEVYPRLVQLYSEVAAANYAKVGKQFDTVAGRFTTAAVAGNPEADASALVSEPDPVRKGWLDAAVYAAELDRLHRCCRPQTSCAGSTPATTPGCCRW